MIARMLLPKGRAWAVIVSSKLKSFMTSFDASLEDDVKNFSDSVYEDIFPATTRQLDNWDEQFGLIEASLPDAERRARLDAAWKATGGQAVDSIQDVLHTAGFDVYLHDWWVPGGNTPRNPLTYIQQTFPGLYAGVQCGETVFPRAADCGEVWAQCGNSLAPPGYPLVNKIPDVPRVVPTEVEKHPYFIYIGGEVFGTVASVDANRRDEFETLCLKLCPTHMWLAMLVEY